MIEAVLFDLDGTLADTASDLAYTLNHMRGTRGLPPLPLSVTRPVTSLAAPRLLKVGFGLAPDHPEPPGMRSEFPRISDANSCRPTCLFPGMAEVARARAAGDACWGVVTNKAEHLARLLLGRSLPTPACACIVGGDTTPHTKPHPAPLLAACGSIRRNAAA